MKGNEIIERIANQQTLFEELAAVANKYQESHADLLAALKGLLALNEKQFRMLEKTAGAGFARFTPDKPEFEKFIFVIKSRAAIAKAEKLK